MTQWQKWQLTHGIKNLLIDFILAIIIHAKAVLKTFKSKNSSQFCVFT